MRTHRIVLALVSLAAPVWGNVYTPKAKLAGETVYARLSKDSASVSAVFAFEDWITRDAKIVYFPIFATDAADPTAVLSRAEVEFEVGEKRVGIAVPCDAPKGMKQSVAGARVFWFSANLDDLISVDDVDPLRPVVVRFSYSQPLINGRFYYLPIIAGQSADEQPWKYQLFVRSVSKAVQVTSKGSEFVALADIVAVYLKDREIVEIR